MVLDLYISNNCNLNCDFCYLKNHKSAPINYKKLIDIIYNLNPEKILFIAKEPLLGDLDKILFIMDKFPNKKYILYSNLTLKLTNKMIEIIKRCEHLTTSFDVKYRFKNVKNLNKWIHNVKYIKKYNINNEIEVLITTTDEAIKIKPEKYVKMFKKLDISYYGLSMLSRPDELMDKKIDSYSNSELFKWLREFFIQENSEHLILSVFENTIKRSRQYLSINNECEIIDPLNRKKDIIPNSSIPYLKCLKCEFYKPCGGLNSNSSRCVFNIDLYNLGKKILKERNFKYEL